MLIPAAGCGAETQPGAADEAAAQSRPAGAWQLELLVHGSQFHGVHGLAFDENDGLFAASILGQAVYRVNRGLGSAKPFVEPAFGQSDGIEFGPDHELVWSAFIDGAIRARAKDGTTSTLATGLMGAAAVGFRDCDVDAPRLYAATALAGGALYEISYPKAEKPEDQKRLLGEIAGLTGFDFGCDGKLYGALVTSGQIVRIDVDAPTLAPEPIVGGFRAPSDVKFDAKGNLYAIDAGTGEVFRIDVDEKTRTAVAQAPTTLDKMAFDAQGHLFVSVPADNAIVAVNVETGEVQTILDGPLAAPSDLAVVQEGDREWLYVADTFSLKRVDLQSGRVESVARVWENDWTLGSHIDVRGDAAAVGSWATQSVQILDRKSGGRIYFIENMGIVQDVLFLEDGMVLYALYTGEIIRMNRKGGARTVVAKGLTGPTGLAKGPGNTVYVTETLAGRLISVDLGSGAVTELVTDLSEPEGLAVMRDGRVAVAEVGNERMIAVDPSSRVVEVLRDQLPIGLALTATPVPLIVIPTGVAVDAEGNIYFTSDLENAIYRLRPPNAKAPEKRDG
jgi:sugar lactone lactonase YvrE